MYIINVLQQPQYTYTKQMRPLFRNIVTTKFETQLVMTILFLAAVCWPC